MILLHLAVCACVTLAAAIIGWVVATLVVFGHSASDGAFSFVAVIVAIANGIAAWQVCQRQSADGARWVWVPVVVWSVFFVVPRWPVQHPTIAQRLSYIWNELFVFNNGTHEEEAFYKFVALPPFFGSVAYAVTAVLFRWDSNGPPAPTSSE